MADMAAVMAMVMATVIRWAVITTARPPDGRTDARSAGAVTAARPACGSKAAAEV